MCHTVLGSSVDSQTVLWGHCRLLQLLVAYLKRFRTALNKSAIITTQRPLQWNVNEGTVPGHPLCHLAGSRPQLREGRVSCPDWALLHAPEVKLPQRIAPCPSPSTRPLNAMLQRGGLNWGRHNGDKSMETWQQQSVASGLWPKWALSLDLCDVGSQPLWRVSFLICRMGTRSNMFESLLNWRTFWYEHHSPVVGCKSVFRYADVCMGHTPLCNTGSYLKLRTNPGAQ